METLPFVGVEAEVELVVPAELGARFRQRVVADLCARAGFGEIGGVGGELGGDDAFLCASSLAS